MNSRMTKYQKNVFQLLLDKYESSKTYKWENKLNQRFSIKPDEIVSDYSGDFTDIDCVRQFNREMKELEETGLIILVQLKHSDDILKIGAIPEKIPVYYELTGREDISAVRQAQIEMYEKYKGVHKILDCFCETQIERLSNYKNAEYSKDVASNLLKLLKYIFTNTHDVMERELSIRVLSDSKLFQEKYRKRVRKILETYGEFDLDFRGFEDKEKSKIILEEFRVFSNPSYIYLKGDFEIRYRNGYVLRGYRDIPLAISSTTLDEIEKVVVLAGTIITIENLTAYNRYVRENTVLLYLSGYHNTAKQTFLKKIASDNEGISWFHFGDIDPDGYYILKNLAEKTGILFQPLYMDISYLEKYRKYCKPLEKNDVVKANSLLKNGKYCDIMEYMLENRCKLEQEIISWMEQREQ